jgi:hypothetical protein
MQRTPSPDTQPNCPNSAEDQGALEDPFGDHLFDWNLFHRESTRFTRPIPDEEDASKFDTDGTSSPESSPSSDEEEDPNDVTPEEIKYQKMSTNKMAQRATPPFVMAEVMKLKTSLPVLTHQTFKISTEEEGTHVSNKQHHIDKLDRL